MARFEFKKNFPGDLEQGVVQGKGIGEGSPYASRQILEISQGRSQKWHSGKGTG